MLLAGKRLPFKKLALRSSGCFLKNQVTNNVSRLTVNTIWYPEQVHKSVPVLYTKLC